MPTPIPTSQLPQTSSLAAGDNIEVSALNSTVFASRRLTLADFATGIWTLLSGTTLARTIIAASTRVSALATLMPSYAGKGGQLAFVRADQTDVDYSDAMVIASGYVRHKVRLVADLTPANLAGIGAEAYVSNATATTARSIVAGGGSNLVKVFSNGTNWLIAG